jgi:phosphoglycerol transferase MdoB-like AlkP superfamily enzyme
MKKTYNHFLKLFLFFTALFALGRIFFFLVNHQSDASFSWSQSLLSFVYGFRMDLSVTTYVLIPSIFFSIIFLFWPKSFLKRVEYFYLLFIIFIAGIILPANILLYHYWNSLLNYRALSYLKDFGEIASSFTFAQIAVLLITLTAFFIFLYFIFKRFLYENFQPVFVSFSSRLLNTAIIIIATIILMRGGVQMLPMNESLVSVSENNFINQATVNPAWHLFNDIYRAGIFEGNPFEMMPKDSAQKRVSELFACVPDSFPKILTTKDPNIVLIILESFTADLVGVMGGEKRISPSLDSLANAGILFNNIYASGTRTDQGIVSLLNGWPATLYNSIMRSTEKSAHLPSLPIIFKEHNYKTSFYYGGESNFSNLKTYIINQKFDNIIDIKNFSDTISHGRWGMHDETVFRRQINDLEKIEQPFFSVIMTLSNHEPFDVPPPVRIKGNSDADLFRNSAAYSDAALGQFIRNAKNESWFSNTLFIIVADHGHNLPLHKSPIYYNSHKIPMIFFGDVIRPEFRGAIVTKLGGHHDLAGTLLPQLEINKKEFSWSKNLLNPTVKPFAYYHSDHVLGWIDPKYWFAYSYLEKRFIARSYKMSLLYLDSMRVDGQAFEQVLYSNYLSY